MSTAEQVLFFLGVLATTGLLMKWKRKRVNGVYRCLPSLPSLPLFGSVPFLIKNFNHFPEFLMKKAEDLGPIFTLKVGNRIVLTLNSKDAIEKAYVRNSSAFSDRPEFFLEGMSNPEFKGIIFKRNPSEWKKQHQLSLSVLKEFGFGIKSVMETIICKEVEAMTDFIKNKQGNMFDPREMCFLATSNVIMNILLGRRNDYDLGMSKICELVHRWATLFSMIYDIVPVSRYIPSYRRLMTQKDDISREMFECMETEIAECVRNPGEPYFVQSYIQKAGSDYDPVQLNYLLRDLIGAGTDTSSTTLQWALVAMANNPDIQKRLHAEIDAVVTGDRLPTLQDQAKLPYVEATILEISRWRTLVPLSLPRQTARDCVVDDYFIPEGTMVIANLHAAHNDISVWRDPEVFRPERFLDSDNNVIGKDRVLPFSVGRRSCLGEILARAELFLIFTSLVKFFLVLPPEGQDKVSDPLKVPVEIVLYVNPFKIRLIERKGR